MTLGHVDDEPTRGQHHLSAEGGARFDEGLLRVIPRHEMREDEDAHAGGSGMLCSLARGEVDIRRWGGLQATRFEQGYVYAPREVDEGTRLSRVTGVRHCPAAHRHAKAVCLDRVVNSRGGDREGSNVVFACNEVFKPELPRHPGIVRKVVRPGHSRSCPPRSPDRDALSRTGRVISLSDV